MKTTIPDEDFIESAVFLLNDLVTAGSRYGVAIALENLSVYWNRAEVLDKVLFEFAPEELGLCLDPINFYWYGHPRSKVYDLFNQFLPRATHFHVKNVKHPVDKREREREPGWKYSDNSVPADKGDLDFERLIGLLVDADYDGYISIEDDSLEQLEPEQRLAVLKSDVEYVQKLVKGYRGGR
jgi:sugar phosphate isomerase/epimerase